MTVESNVVYYLYSWYTVSVLFYITTTTGIHASSTVTVLPSSHYHNKAK